MTRPGFEQRVIVEQVRSLEQAGVIADDDSVQGGEYPAHSDFDSRLWQRAQRLAGQHDLWLLLGRASGVARSFRVGALILVALIGALASLAALSDDRTINIYWLLLVLLGFNLASMLLWLAGIGLGRQSIPGRSVLASALRWLTARAGGHGRGAAADRAWVACHYSGRVGKWQLSVLTHQLWLAYLLAGLASLLLALMARQFDFVWGTTLLSDAAFVRLTEVLALPLQALGLVTPTADQVLESRIGAAQVLTAGHRSAWAQLLLGALLCFGVLPRLLMLAWSSLLRGAARHSFVVDHYLPYYVALHQQLMPLASHGQVTDPDDAPVVVRESIAGMPVAHALPDSAHWVWVELGERVGWPPVPVTTEQDLGHVVDRRSLERVQGRLQGLGPGVLAVAVAAHRAPDRGVQRTVATLAQGQPQTWLVLLHDHAQQGLPEGRLAAWYRLAEACEIPAAQVVRMNMRTDAQ